MIEKLVTLKPIVNNNGHVEEQVLLFDDGYPVALFHIDFVWDKFSNEIYEQLSDGKTVVVEMRLMEVTQ